MPAAGCPTRTSRRSPRRELPAEHLEDYFAHALGPTDEDRVVIASTGFGDLDWQPLAPESVTAISMYDLSMTHCCR